MSETKLIIDGNSLTIESIYEFLHSSKRVEISPDSLEKVKKARILVEQWVDSEEVIYGVTTGFGDFSNVSISKNNIIKLQQNLIRSHAVGCGEALDKKIVKVMMLLRANALSKGYSGIKPATLDLLIRMINLNIIPYVPSQGSVGSSGDLVPLAHLAMSLMGEGEAYDGSEVGLEVEIKLEPVSAILARHQLAGIIPGAKEGLALINGTQMMTAFAAVICAQARRLAKTADISASLTHEAIRGTDKAYDERLHKLRPYEGQIAVAKNILLLIEGSEIRRSHIKDDTRIQDAYSIRCIPQIHGASRDAIDYVCSRVEIEINSANDNPLIFPEEGDHLEGGNFHGQPMALAMDFLCIALAEFASVAERRIERLVNGALSNGLPRFLASGGGLNSGFMIAQYTAASLVSENKVLAHPASVDSIPTSANQEDHNSMGSISARKCFQIMKNLENVLAIELMAAAQGVEFLKPLKPGKGTLAAFRAIREVIPSLNEDRFLFNDLKKMNDAVKSGFILAAVSLVVELN